MIATYYYIWKDIDFINSPQFFVHQINALGS